MMVKCFFVVNLVTFDSVGLTSIGLVALIFNPNRNQKNKLLFLSEPRFTQGLDELHPSPPTFVKAWIHL